MTTLAEAPPVSHLPVPTSARWRPLRAGLQNMWQYDHSTRFVFHRGRLLLHGRNGSGKTKAVEMLAPFLLEGRLDPVRLDPFRTRSRKMRYNLLHEANRDAQMAVGYAWMEFGRLDGDGTERYTTVGAGLKARRSDDRVDSWFFVVEGRRVDRDLDLLDGDLRPLGKPKLIEALGDDGRVFDGQRDYAAAVNRALFGLTATQYEALVEAVLRLRQPHLSERLDPVEVGAVLSDSLPPLDAEKVHEVAEGFERLEAHRRDLLDRRRSLEAVEGFLAEYRTYARVVAAARARDLTSADAAVRDAAGRIAAAQTTREEADARAAALAREAAQVEEDLTRTDARIEELTGTEEFSAVRDLERATRALNQEERRAAEAAKRRDADADDLADLERRRSHAAEQVETKRADGQASLRNARTHATRADLDAAQHQLAALADRALQDEAATALDAVRGTAASLFDARRTAIANLREAGSALAGAEQSEQAARERADQAHEDAAEAAAAVTRTEASVEAAVTAFAASVTAWAAATPELAVTDEQLDTLTTADPAETAGHARALVQPVRERLDAEIAAARLHLEGQRQARSTVAEERDALAATTHQPPGVPAWRTAERSDRPGAPLYLLAELDGRLEPAAHGPVEAALEAAGLLDAWVTPDGRMLDPGTLDVVLPGGPPASGRTLADVASPTPSGGVDRQVVSGVLARIGVLGGQDGDGTESVPAGTDGGGARAAAQAWVATDGQFRIGPLRGRASRDRARYLGETARRRERERRLGELAARLDTMDTAIAEHTTALEGLHERRRAVETGIDSFPPTTEVDAARARLAAAADRLHEARAQADRLVEAHARAEARRTEARQHRDLLARDLGLTAHVDTLDELDAATADWRAAVGTWVGDLAALPERLARLAELDRDVHTASDRAEGSARDAAQAETERADAAERVRTLQGVVGTAHEQVLADLEAARRHKAERTDRRRSLAEEYTQAREQLAVATTEMEAATADQARLDGERTAAARIVRGLAELGVLQVVLDRPLPGAGDWSVRTALEHAREAARHGPALPPGVEEMEAMLESAQNTLARRQQELLRDLVAGIRLFGRTDHGVVVHDVQYQGRTFRLPDLVAELREDVDEREARLAGDEQELLESFLAGELHEHLRNRIRDADDLVGVMNRRLAECATTAGQQVRLDWAVSDEAPAGTPEAVDLLLRGAGLLDDDQRADLSTFLHDRLREARDGDAAASLQERLASAFDYRRWHAFSVQVRDRTATSWRRLTRQTHATGSGGEKAVMLHLPLFAAMAAHYEASPTAPRLIVLDEVFAGIDRGTRGQLMGLLVELDLDALFTSHEEWGFYAELDGISTYHLIRDPDVPGVFPEWFVWDGDTTWEMG